jgi:2-polyprenyl-3-methyl-5-hydroxy-6-metoxy-1,4-benzoquinol methylase
VIEEGIEVSRKVGITSIGAGGVSAHIIIEEHIAKPKKLLLKKDNYQVLLVLSAKNKDRLESYVKKWIKYLKEKPIVDLASVGYTLQVGRESMNARLAIIAATQEEWLSQLKKWSEENTKSETCFYGDIDSALVQKKTINHTSKLSLEKVAKLWIDGAKINWQDFSCSVGLSRVVGLPTYPFVERICWFQPVNNKGEKEYENKAAEFYSTFAKNAQSDGIEEYLTFCPFPERISGFSMSKVVLNPDRYPEEQKVIKSKQIEMRQVLFSKVDFNQIHSLFDFGCGHGTDIIEISTLYPHIQSHGFTITEEQADLGNTRIKKRNLESRVKIFYKNSAEDIFPSRYDLIIGVEVSFHIRNKDQLFHNIASSLQRNGQVLLMDYISNLKGPIIDTQIEINIPTQQGWAEMLSKQHLIIDEIIDVSSQISNFLYDPEVELNIQNLSIVAQKTFRSYANQSISFDKGWISYCLFKIKKDDNLSNTACFHHNIEKLTNKTPYSVALDEMKKAGFSSYPQGTKNQKINA